MPNVYEVLQSSFVSFSWPWSGRSPPLREPVGLLGSWTGAQCGQAPSSPPPTIWPTQSLIGWHFVTWLVGWPIAAGWLANKMSTWHLPRIWPNVNLTQSSITLGHKMSLPMEYIWPKVSLTQSLTTCQPNLKPHLGVTSDQISAWPKSDQMSAWPKASSGDTSDERRAWPEESLNVNLTWSLIWGVHLTKGKPDPKSEQMSMWPKASSWREGINLPPSRRRNLIEMLQNYFWSTCNSLSTQSNFFQNSQFLSDWMPISLFILIFIFTYFCLGMFRIDSGWSDMAWQMMSLPQGEGI